MRKIASQLPLGLALAAALQLGAPARAWAQEEGRETGWFNTTELSFVLTAGNAESSTLGFGNKLEHIWPRSALRIDFGGVRSESSLITRTAIGTSPADFELDEQKTTEKTAESYFAEGRYDWDLSAKFFLYGGAGWNRNTFAGIENRYALVAGVGNTWVDSEVSKFRTDYGLTYTKQEDVVENPNVKDSFAGFRLSYDYVRALTETTEFASQLVLDDNLDNTEDLRANFLNSLAVAISQKLALKTSLLLAYDNLPSLTTVPLFFPDGTPADEAVAVELDKLDTYFTVALVVKI